MNTLLRAGDRIVTAFPLAEHAEVSGIVGHAYDIGRGDFIVLVYVGGESFNGKTTPTYESVPVNLLAIDIVERGCVFPPIPAVVIGAFQRAVNHAARRAKRDRFEDAVMEVCRKNIPPIDKMDMPLLPDPDNVIGNSTDDGLRHALLCMVTKMCREEPATGDELFRTTMLAAFIERFDDLVSQIRKSSKEPQ